MKVVICGSRDIENYQLVEQAVRESGFDITEVVSGRCRGVDRLGEEWATGRGIRISCFPADWKRFGASAGFIRNEAMVRYADMVIAIWDGKSKGTRHTIELCKKSGKAIYVKEIK